MLMEVDDMKVEISVVIPCYNQEKYVAECLDSVLAQTFSDFEVIVVNDGSTDESLKILEEYAKKDNRIIILNQSNQGVVASRNNAINMARGKYIYPLDADDLIAPTCLEKLYQAIEKSNYRVVACNVRTFGLDSYFFEQPKFTKYQMYGKHECCVISALFYKEDFIRFGGYKMDFNGYGGDDMDYWLNYVDCNLPMLRIPEELFFYRMKPFQESVWKNYTRDVFEERRRIKDALLLKYHPKMKWWAILYRIQWRLLRFFYYCGWKKKRPYLRVLGVKFYLD